MTRNNFPTLTQDLLDAIASHMDDQIREDVHSAHDWQHPGEFLTEYLQRDPKFPIAQFRTAAETVYQDSEAGSPKETALRLVADQADDAVEAARTALAKSDEERTWQLTEEGEGYDTVKAGSAAEALDIARDNVDRDNYGYSDDQRTLYVDVRVNCEATGEEAEATVALEPDEPECGEREGHDWKSPWSVLGGLKENPGAWGHGGGVVVKEVCAHCGRYRVTDTWAQRRDTGEQGLTEVKYEDADETSSEWVASLAGDAE